MLSMVGGGFLKGSSAQEESLARASGLYDCLTLAHVEQYYLDNRQDHTCLYTNSIIYSPSVPVFRDDSTNQLLHEPFLLSFITSPAVNLVHAAKRVQDPDIITRVMEERMRRILLIAALNKQYHLVLGAWGCGVFGNSALDVALMWRSFLIEGEFKNAFETIVFAVTNEKMASIFKSVLDPAKPSESSDSVLTSPTNDEDSKLMV